MAGLTPEPGLTSRPYYPPLPGPWFHEPFFSIPALPVSVPLPMLSSLPGVLVPTGQVLHFLQAQLRHLLWKAFLIPQSLHVLVGLYESR